MSQRVDSPPEQTRIPQPPRNRRARFSRASIVTMLALICLLLLLFSGLLLSSLPQLTRRTTSVAATQVRHSPQTSAPASTATQDQDQDITVTPTLPILVPRNVATSSLQLPPHRYVIYQEQNTLYALSTDDGQAQVIRTQGYSYNQAVQPILTPSGDILYSGNGLWLTDVFGGTPVQIAGLAPGEVITSLTLSDDGKMVAWTTEPVGGRGMIDIHAGPLVSSTIVYEQSALVCPCFRVFSFMNGPGSQGDNTLLLTDDQGSHEAAQYGLWSLDLSTLPATPQPTPTGTTSAQATPTSVLDENPQQGPLVLSPTGNTLLYSSNEGWVPIPSDQSVPQDIGSLTYPNSLDLTTLDGSPPTTGTSQVILPEQHNLNNNAAYYWATTPVFSPDSHTLVYIQFTSDAQEPFDRHSAIFTVQLSGSGTQLHASSPQLLATSTAKLLELGTWLDNDILTFYGDGSLYALNIRSGAVTTLLHVGTYARVVAVLNGSSS